MAMLERQLKLTYHSYHINEQARYVTAMRRQNVDTVEAIRRSSVNRVVSASRIWSDRFEYYNLSKEKRRCGDFHIQTGGFFATLRTGSGEAREVMVTAEMLKPGVKMSLALAAETAGSLPVVFPVNSFL
jgi:hypothetical protein